MGAAIDFARSALDCDASSHRFFAASPFAGEFDLCFELNTRFLHLAIGQQPYEGFIVKINHLNAIPPWITKVAAKRRFQFEFVFLGKFLSHFLELRFIANHDPEMPHVCSLNFLDFENGEELMVTQFEKRVALAATHLFEVENILVKGHRFLNVIHLDRDMIASINLHAHMSAYLKKHAARSVFSSSHCALRISGGSAHRSCHSDPAIAEEFRIFCSQASTQAIIRDVSLRST
jgi:hypothetical protein